MMYNPDIAMTNFNISPTIPQKLPDCETNGLLSSPICIKFNNLKKQIHRFT